MEGADYIYYHDHTIFYMIKLVFFLSLIFLSLAQSSDPSLLNSPSARKLLAEATSLLPQIDGWNPISMTSNLTLYGHQQNFVLQNNKGSKGVLRAAYSSDKKSTYIIQILATCSSPFSKQTQTFIGYGLNQYPQFSPSDVQNVTIAYQQGHTFYHLGVNDPSLLNNEIFVANITPFSNSFSNQNQIFVTVDKIQAGFILNATLTKYPFIQNYTYPLNPLKQISLGLRYLVFLINPTNGDQIVYQLFYQNSQYQIRQVFHVHIVGYNDHQQEQYYYLACFKRPQLCKQYNIYEVTNIWPGQSIKYVYGYKGGYVYYFNYDYKGVNYSSFYG